MSGNPASLRERFAHWTAAPMLGLSVLFLATTAALIVLWVDVPRVRESYALARAAAGTPPTESEMEAALGLDTISHQLGLAGLMLAGALWCLFILEYLAYHIIDWCEMREDPQQCLPLRSGLHYCLLPPLRLGMTNPFIGDRIWLPGLGWRRRSRLLRERLERIFGLPMIIIALMILPVLLVEFTLQAQIAEHLWLRLLLHISTGVIWFAFALEFIVMFSVTEKRLRYCQDHWLDLAIILFPLISFLRSLRVVQTMRFARLAKVSYLTKMARMYRLRGLAIKAFRALLLFDMLNRLLGVSPEKQLEKLRLALLEKRRDVRELKRRIAQLERGIEARAAADEVSRAAEAKADAMEATENAAEKAATAVSD